MPIVGIFHHCNTIYQYLVHLEKFHGLNSTYKEFKGIFKSVITIAI
jgi:hypothetical protein